MPRENASDTHAMHSRVICGHVFWLGAQAGRLLLKGSDLVVLKIVKVVESIDKTMRLQLKFVTRRHILAIRTRVLIF